MSEFNSIERLGTKQPLGRLSSKTQVSLETQQKAEAVTVCEQTKEIRKLEFEMEQADHAFALMMEIRQKIEVQYKELSSSEKE